MVTITTEPATPDRWADVQRTLTGGGDGASCQCLWWTHRAKDFSAMSAEQRKTALHAEITAGPPPGLVAYVDDDAAGWVRIGPRPTQHRIAHTRAIVTATPEPLDDSSVWALTCFSVRKEHRRQGVARVLLERAVDLARKRGARIIEAYPIDTEIRHASANDLYHGALSTFIAAGFHITGSRGEGRPIVSRELSP